MLKKFRKKIEKEGRVMTWFHREYLRKSRTTYTYFIQQLNGHANMQPIVETAIQAYLDKKD